MPGATVSAPPASAAPQRAYIDWELRRLRAELAALPLPDARVREIFAYFNAQPGKLLRPRLLFALCARCGVRVNAEIRTMALALELLHSASLLQDDVFDRETVRRGRPSANAVFGDKQAMLAGEYILLLAIQVADCLGDPKLRRLLHEAAKATCSGELAGDRLDEPRALTLANYLRAVRGKTGAAFRLCGQMVSHYNGQLGAAAEEDAAAAGELYQFLDDLTDSEQILSRGRAYTLAEVASLPLVFYLARGGKLTAPFPPGQSLLQAIESHDGYEMVRDFLRRQYRWDYDCGDDAFDVMRRGFFEGIDEILERHARSRREGVLPYRQTDWR